MTPPARGSRARRVAILVVTGVFVACGGIAGADVPNDRDIAACNQTAREEFRSRSIAPISKDEAGADAARTAAPTGGPEHATQSPDPQIHGMNGEGARDAAYRAVYRVCMRKSGF
jgi:hypothetical protein